MRQEMMGKTVAMLAISLFTAVGPSRLDIPVDAFGATGNGVVCDDQAVQLAIGAAGAGDTISFSAGKTYLFCRPVTISTSLTLTGPGARLRYDDEGSTTLTAPAARKAVSLSVASIDGFRVGQSLTLSTDGGNDINPGSYRIASIDSANLVIQLSGGTVGSDFPAGTLVTSEARFFEIEAPDVTFVDLKLDGNYEGNNTIIRWQASAAIKGQADKALEKLEAGSSRGPVPATCRPRLRTTKMLGRFNEEIRRRGRLTASFQM